MNTKIRNPNHVAAGFFVNFFNDKKTNTEQITKEGKLTILAARPVCHK